MKMHFHNSPLFGNFAVYDIIVVSACSAMKFCTVNLIKNYMSYFVSNNLKIS